MSIFNGKQRLAEAIFTGIDYSLYIRHDLTEPFMPYIMTFKDGEITNRLVGVSDSPEETLNQMMQAIGQPYDYAVMCMEARVSTGDGAKQDAIMVKGFDTSEPMGMLFGQRFNAPETGVAFGRIGRPTLFGQEVPLPVALVTREPKEAEAPYISAIAAKNDNGTVKKIVIAGHSNASMLAHELVQYTRNMLEEHGTNFSGEMEFSFVPTIGRMGAFEKWLYNEMIERIQSQPAVIKWEKQYARKLVITLNFNEDKREATNPAQ